MAVLRDLTKLGIPLAFAIGCAACFGCQPQPPKGDQRAQRYGRYYNDFQQIRTLLYEFGEHKSRRLTPEEISQMKRLQGVDNPVSIEATALLAASAYRGDAGLKRELIQSIPRLAADPSVHANLAALSLTKWFAKGENLGTFESLLTRIRAKSSPTVDEQNLASEIEFYLRSPKE